MTSLTHKGSQGFWAPCNNHDRFSQSVQSCEKSGLRDSHPSYGILPATPYVERMESAYSFDPNPPSVHKTGIQTPGVGDWRHSKGAFDYPSGSLYRVIDNPGRHNDCMSNNIKFTSKISARSAHFDPLWGLVFDSKEKKGPQIMSRARDPALVRNQRAPHSASGVKRPAPKSEWKR
mmetsp:Transcript_11999/g.18806  ORF Transcript_11999/g.18806 Transcript_11999/m.18806 type:complete len:176 (-) Transcript_11999:165-692(-)